ncbi:hypothetical protein [Paenibacillus ihuae]|uniref:hypothetical protein n=1 Tax=Paenibacillus ihuae TaxID=1232431 RepID=UPI0006D571C2|nr:hypothetical protein [Paenibacillus ihuae]
MKSYAIWCKNNDLSAVPKLDVHINLWKLPKRKNRFLKLFNYSENNYMLLDFGLKVSEISQVSEIKIFLPYTINKEQILDLGEFFLNHTNLIIGVFNKDYTVEIGTEPKQILINKGETDEFIIYLLDIQNEDCAIEEKFGGSLITIKIPEELKTKNKPLYYRFRINSPALNSMVKRIKASSIFESALAYTEVVDLRFNEKRLYERSMSEKVKEEGEFKIEKLHFLLMTNAQDEIISTGEGHSCRQLEDIWNNYTQEEYDLENILAYHWKAKDVSSHNSLVKLKIQRSTLRKVIIYLITLGILSIIYNLVTDPIKEHITEPLGGFINNFFTNREGN